MPPKRPKRVTPKSTIGMKQSTFNNFMNNPHSTFVLGGKKGSGFVTSTPRNAKRSGIGRGYKPGSAQSKIKAYSSGRKKVAAKVKTGRVRPKK